MLKKKKEEERLMHISIANYATYSAHTENNFNIHLLLHTQKLLGKLREVMN